MTGRGSSLAASCVFVEAVGFDSWLAQTRSQAFTCPARSCNCTAVMLARYPMWVIVTILPRGKIYPIRQAPVSLLFPCSSASGPMSMDALAVADGSSAVHVLDGCTTTTYGKEGPGETALPCVEVHAGDDVE